MPHKHFPLAMYTLTHFEDHRAHIHTCVHFITYGDSYGPANVKGPPLVLDLDLSNNWAPPENLCNKYNGLHERLATSFFTDRANRAQFYKALRTLERLKQRQTIKQTSCVACLVHCTIGRHRSVAMAERLAKEVGSWAGFKAECLHLDIWKGIETPSENAPRPYAAEMKKDESARGYTGSRHPKPATSEIRTSETNRTGTTPTAAAVPPPKEAPLRRKSVSWAPTKPVELHPPRYETAGRSAAPSEEGYKIRHRRLSS